MLCCTSTYACMQLCIHKKDESNIGDVGQDQVPTCDGVSLSQVSSVDMDNYNTNGTAALQLKNHGILHRGTMHQNRFLLLKGMLFTKAESRKETRGSHCFAVNEQHSIVAVGWLHENHVHMVTAADGTVVTTVQRCIRNTIQTVVVPTAIKSKMMPCKTLAIMTNYVKHLLCHIDMASKSITSSFIYAY